MSGQDFFILDGIKYGVGTKIQLKYEFYKRHKELTYHIRFYPYERIKPCIFNGILFKDGKTVWHFNIGFFDDFVWEQDVEEIVLPIYHKTDEDRIREKKDQGRIWEYIWPGTIVYVLCMLFITVFNERLWGWIAATILYVNYCREQLSKK